MGVLGGIYTPDVEPIPLTGAVTVTQAIDVAGAHRGPVCVVCADASGGTITVTEGYLTGPTGASFVAEQRIGYVIAPAAGPTAETAILKVVQPNKIVSGTQYGKAIQIALSGGYGHVRITGKTIAV